MMKKRTTYHRGNASLYTFVDLIDPTDFLSHLSHLTFHFHCWSRWLFPISQPAPSKNRPSALRRGAQTAWIFVPTQIEPCALTASVLAHAITPVVRTLKVSPSMKNFRKQSAFLPPSSLSAAVSSCGLPRPANNKPRMTAAIVADCDANLSLKERNKRSRTNERYFFMSDKY